MKNHADKFIITQRECIKYIKYVVPQSYDYDVCTIENIVQSSYACYNDEEESNIIADDVATSSAIELF